ncbi:MAG: acyl-ACP--UDP-N-acetylglucosamine O-acyltransferase [Burkholderiaceae bacterium]
MAKVHSTALVDPKAELAADVEVGPYCIVGPLVKLGPGTVLDAHVVVGGRTTVGRGNRFFPFCAIGGAPQDKKYGGEDTELVIGDGNTVREHCTFSLGTVQGGGVTRVGSDNWIMASVHIAHDCMVGDHTILANNVTLAGHVTLGDWVILGGLSGLHQFCSVGAHAMAGGGSIILRDIPPYVICNGNPCAPHGINSEGLKRRGFDGDTINQLRRAYKAIYRDGKTVAEAVAALDELIAEAPASAGAVALLRDFVRDAPRGIIR